MLLANNVVGDIVNEFSIDLINKGNFCYLLVAVPRFLGFKIIIFNSQSPLDNSITYFTREIKTFNEYVILS